jgi:hypothetical protein
VTDPFIEHSYRLVAAQVQHALPPQEGSGNEQLGADDNQQQAMQVEALSTALLSTVPTLPAHQHAGAGAPQHETQQQEPSQGLGDTTPDQDTLPGHLLPGQQGMGPGPLTILQGTVIGSTEASQQVPQAAETPAASVPATAAPAGEVVMTPPATTDQEVWGFGDSMADVLIGLGNEPLNLEEIDTLLSPFDIELDMQDMQ